ncbi:MAG: MBL fold metallo-hydrolase [bacterium]|nr:MBL fold metallo-hydrolase [bacterium]
MAKPLEFRQLFDEETSTFTYLLFDGATKEGILIDSVLEQVDRDVQLLKDLGVKLVYTLDTHVHADHITGAGKLREQLGCKFGLGKGAGLECADLLMADGETLEFSGHQVKALATPGHTDGCTSFLIDDMVFTGDALFIRGCGRTDFQQGSPERLWDSVKNQLFTLPDATKVYPGHDYKGMTMTTVAEEKALNPRLGGTKTKEEFVQIMNNLNLPYPKKLDASLPANLACGMVLKEAAASA